MPSPVTGLVCQLEAKTCTVDDRQKTSAHCHRYLLCCLFSIHMAPVQVDAKKTIVGWWSDSIRSKQAGPFRNAFAFTIG